ncbi:histidine phosphatase family protein [Nocardioides donggukensis]|uniref:Histidine phosphatase family protein n=1 Tax=Nocardioides donggukensis TaxID=2774019 RepID=A0A927K4Y6_9ACTN|nr:histidine phosphatase family protein [Nocardioides donggukensis]MBD8870334.1 histidine phosphatase family protein [Nocardioides donggukensis]
MDLLLVRHAQTHANVAGALDTALPGADLTELGERQARALVDLLADERIDAVWCSPTLRTRRTAEGVARAHGLTPRVHPGLVEISAGDWEMSTADEHGVAYREAIVAGVSGGGAALVPGGESADQVFARFDAAIAEIRATGAERVAVVSHGAVLRAWCGARVPNVPAALVRDRPLGNTGLVRLHSHDGGWAASEWDTELVRPGGAAGPAAQGTRETSAPRSAGRP